MLREMAAGKCHSVIAKTTCEVPTRLLAPLHVPVIARSAPPPAQLAACGYVRELAVCYLIQLAVVFPQI